jgi:hypothetical protein
MQADGPMARSGRQIMDLSMLKHPQTELHSDN